jgi:hypothetical protein
MYASSSGTLAGSFSRHQGYATALGSGGKLGLDPIVMVGSHLNKEAVPIDEIFWSKNFDWINQKWRTWRGENDW